MPMTTDEKWRFPKHWVAGVECPGSGDRPALIRGPNAEESNGRGILEQRGYDAGYAAGYAAAEARYRYGGAAMGGHQC